MRWALPFALFAIACGTKTAGDGATQVSTAPTVASGPVEFRPLRKHEPISITGQVRSQDGSALVNSKVFLTPRMHRGQARELELNSEGTFETSFPRGYVLHVAIVGDGHLSHEFLLVVGDPVNIDARLGTPDFESDASPQLRARWTGSTRSKETFELNAIKDGRFVQVKFPNKPEGASTLQFQWLPSEESLNRGTSSRNIGDPFCDKTGCWNELPADSFGNYLRFEASALWPAPSRPIVQITRRNGSESVTSFSPISSVRAHFLEQWHQIEQTKNNDGFLLLEARKKVGQQRYSINSLGPSPEKRAYSVLFGTVFAPLLGSVLRVQDFDWIFELAPASDPAWQVYGELVPFLNGYRRLDPEQAERIRSDFGRSGIYLLEMQADIAQLLWLVEDQRFDDARKAYELLRVNYSESDWVRAFQKTPKANELETTGTK